MTTTLLIIAGIVGGALSGLVGVGGGVVIVPALVLLLGFSQKTAQGTTLAMLALPVCAFAAVTYFKAGYVNVKTALWLALGFIIGSLVSAHFAARLPEQAATRLFGGVLLLLAAKLLLFPR